MRAVIVFGGWLAGWLLLWRLPLVAPKRPEGRMTSTKRPETRVPVAVVIPARNEAANIAQLVTQLRQQHIPPDEIVVVDDDSSDGTAHRAAAAGATVVSAGPLPSGWTGKSWACHTGSQATTAPVLVFLDADVELAPDALGRLVDHSRPGRLVSVVPWHRVRRPYEWLSLLFGIVAVMGTGAASARRRHVTGAFGPTMVIWRADYDRIGGHAAIASEIVDDLALARQATGANMEVDILGGGDLVRYRMYPDGFRFLWQGWTKNFAAGAYSTPPLRLLGVVTWIASGLTVAYSSVVRAGFWWLAWLAWSAQLAVFARRTGSFPPPAWLAFPLQLAFFITVFAWSIVRVVIMGTVHWRGRTIDIRSSRPHPAET